MGTQKAVVIAFSILLITVACESASTLSGPTSAPPTATRLPPTSTLPLLATARLPTPTAAPAASPSSIFALASSTFKDGETIPVANTCDEQNVSPELHWSGAPLGTASFVLIVDDPNAGGFAHWVLFDIPASATSLAPAEATVGTAGVNDFGQKGYSGPCPPNGDKPHRYAFQLYALDVASLNLPAGARRLDVKQAMLKGKHVLGQAKQIGIYGH